MSINKAVHIFGGGTVAYISSHLAISAPAYGTTARKLNELVQKRFILTDTYLHLTKMADTQIKGPLKEHDLETNEDVANLIGELKKDPRTKVIFFNCAMVDWEPKVLVRYNGEQPETPLTSFGKYKARPSSKPIEFTSGQIYPDLDMTFKPANKLISTIREGRKDIFLVGFKETCGATKQEMFEKGLRLCKESSVNLVLVNDTKTRWNMIITPEEAAYHETDNRDEILKNLVDMAFYRSHLTFTQSTVIAGDPVPWNDSRIPESLRTVVNYCVKHNAYKPFKNATVGHFAVKLSDKEFLTSIRRSNFNELDKTGLVYIKTDGPDTVLAYGAKPSVGGQSQRIVFKDHEGMDCIAHFHCPLKENHADDIAIVSQRNVECGSHECGKQTSSGLKQFGNLKAVYLDNHGPNIVFNKNTNPNEIIEFIERNFDLSGKTGGYIL